MGNSDYDTLNNLQMDAITYEDTSMNCLLLDKGGSCYEKERDKIFFPRMWLSTDPAKLWTLKFLLVFWAMKFRGQNFFKERRM